MGEPIEVEVQARMSSADFDDLAAELRSLGYEARLAQPWEERSGDFPFGTPRLGLHLQVWQWLAPPTAAALVGAAVAWIKRRRKTRLPIEVKLIYGPKERTIAKVSVEADSDSTEDETALRHLRVCARGTEELPNCGTCEKCLRTMVALEAADVLARCPTFPSGRVDPEAVAAIVLRKPTKRAQWEHNLSRPRIDRVEPRVSPCHPPGAESRQGLVAGPGGAGRSSKRAGAGRSSKASLAAGTASPGRLDRRATVPA
jgi:hypothetical protein